MTAKPACRELLPCPFCGADVEPRSDEHGAFVGCHDANCAGFVNAPLHEWNRRASPPSSAAGKWVPMEPTGHMIEVGRQEHSDAMTNRTISGEARLRRVYKAMLSAAPSEPRQGSGKEEK